MQELRVAWLVPVAWFYWQPMLSEFSQLFPQTIVFTALFPGYTKGYEDSLNLKIIGKFKVLKDRKKIAKSQYGSGYTALSPKVIFPLLQYKPDLIFTSSFGLWTMLALLFKPLGRWRVILAYEGSAPGVDFLNSPLRLWLRKLMVEAANGYITNSQRGKAYLVEVLGAEPDKVLARPYEIPAAASLLDNMSERKLNNLPDKKPLFLFVGRIIPRKGLKVLLQACLHLQQQGYSDYGLLVVGDGEQQKELEAFCRSENLTDCVQFTGKVAYKDISCYFQAADVFVLPTVEDTWGVVTLEIMLFGKPVLCSTGAGSAEMIIEGENGYVFAPDSSEQLAALMGKFINQPKLAKTMGVKSQELIAAHTPQAAAASLASIVKSLTNK